MPYVAIHYFTIIDTGVVDAICRHILTHNNWHWCVSTAANTEICRRVYTQIYLLEEVLTIINTSSGRIKT